MKVEVAVLGSPSLIILRFPWAKKQPFNNKRQQKTVRKLNNFPRSVALSIMAVAGEEACR